MRFSQKAALLAVASLAVLSFLCSMSYSRLFKQNSEDVLRSHLFSEAVIAKHLAEAEISLLARKLVELLSEESAMRKQSIQSSKFIASDFVQIAVMKGEAGRWSSEWASLRPGYANRWAEGSHLKLLQDLPFADVGVGQHVLIRQESPDGQPIFALMIPLNQKNNDEIGFKIGVGFFTPTTLAKVMDPFRQTTKEAGLIDDRGFALAFTRQQYAGASLQSHPVVLSLIAQTRPGVISDSKNSQGEDVVFAAQKLDRSNLWVFVSQTPPTFGGGLLSNYLVGLGYALAVGLFFVGGLLWLLKQENLEVIDQVDSTFGIEPVPDQIDKQVSSQEESRPTVEKPETEPVAAVVSLKAESLKSATKEMASEDSRKTDVEASLDKVLTRMKPELDAAGVKIERNIGKLGKVRIARGQLETIFEEVLKNAFEAAAGGREKSIDIRSRHDTRMLTVQISDSGAGMTAATIAKAFDPFFTEKADKEGMGLTVVRGLVNAIGGSVRIESTPHSNSWQRTKVFIDLPLAEPLAEEEKTHITLTSEVTRSSIKHNDHLLDELVRSKNLEDAPTKVQTVTEHTQDEPNDEFQIISRSDSNATPDKEDLTSERDQSTTLQDQAREHFAKDSDHKKRSLFKESIGDETLDLEMSVSGSSLEDSAGKHYKPEIRRPKVRSKS